MRTRSTGAAARAARPWRPLAAALLAVGGLASAATGPLTPEEAAGRRLYQDGIGAGGAPVLATVGMERTQVPGNVVPCGNCHGPDGLGRAEGAVVPPVITWSELTKPYGHLHDNGRRHDAFDAKSFERTLTLGVDPAGQPLDVTMPRYALGRTDLDHLVAYMKRLEQEADPGVHAEQLRIGVLLPGGPMADASRRTRRVVEAVLADLNDAGGLYGRRVELVPLDTGDTRADLMARARDAMAQGDVLAIVAAGIDRELAQLAEAQRVPLLGVAPLADGGPVTRYSFVLQPGPREQVRTLVEYAGHALEAKSRALTLVVADTPAFAALGDAVKAQCGTVGCREVVLHRYPPGRFDAAGALAAHRKDAGAMLFIGPEADLAVLLRTADGRKAYPTILLPGAFGMRAAAQAPAGFDGRVLLATPSVPAEGLGGAPYEAFRQKHRLTDIPTVAQVSPYALAHVLAEGLRRTGKSVSREKLVASLETVRSFGTGVAPPLSYGPDRRIGALGGYVVALDAQQHGFRPLTPWLPLD